MAETTDPKPQQPEDLQAVLARAKGLVESLDTAEVPFLGLDAIPLALPVTGEIADDVPVAIPITQDAGDVPVAAAVPDTVGEEAPPQPDEDLIETIHGVPPEDEPEPAPELPAAPAPPAADAPLPPCIVCQAPRSAGMAFCLDCGYFFTDDSPPVAATPEADVVPTPLSSTLIKGRYELETLLAERQGVQRYRGRDTGHPLTPNVPVVILRQSVAPVVTPVEDEEDVHLTATLTEEVLPGFDFPDDPAVTAPFPAKAQWPNVAWLQELLALVDCPALPAVVASFIEDDSEYLVLEIPTGKVLWDAWDDPKSTNRQRFGWLRQVAEALRELHRGGAILEGIRPEMIVVAADGTARLTHLDDLLPLPIPGTAPIKGTLYTAPEVLSSPGTADARADLYGFGAMLYALHVGRELSDTDFDRPGHPKPFLPRFPDAHPAFGRLMTKTFRRDVASRFPTDEAGREDPTGFKELIQYLDICGRALDTVRLEIAAWTTTGIVRTGNEDAFALLHACESRQDDISEAALVFLCDGMGGYEAGEVAAAMSIQVLRETLTQHPSFKHLTGATSFVAKMPGGNDGNAIKALEADACKQILRAALKETNRQVHQAGRTMPGKRNMGCTAEAVYVDGKMVVVGHVGDSRTYHLHEGQLIQLTRDQTLVNRLVELGTLTAEEAEHHPRRNELQQAIGGQPDVEPGLYASPLSPGDWVVVCSDGVTNHVNNVLLKQMLDSEALSAEMAARRLVNLVNIEGATDNATVVVIRAT